MQPVPAYWDDGHASNHYTGIAPDTSHPPHTHTHVHRQAAYWHNTSTILAAHYPFRFAPQRFGESIRRYRDTLSDSQLSRNAPASQCICGKSFREGGSCCTTKVNSGPIPAPSRRARLIAIANADCPATFIRSSSTPALSRQPPNQTPPHDAISSLASSGISGIRLDGARRIG